MVDVDVLTHPAALLAPVAERGPRALEFLEALVNIDSGSRDAAGVDRVGDLCAARLVDEGWAVERVAPPAGVIAGHPLIARRTGSRTPEQGGRTVLLSAHMDTVFEAGTAQARPFTVREGIATGPGVIDDKSGIVVAVEAVAALLDYGWSDFAEMVLVLSSDEEVGSIASSPAIRAEAKRADFGFGLEGARANGDLVSARKGVAELTLRVAGRAAHAGVEPHKGIHALLEAARLTVALQDLNGRWPDVSCNVGTLRAGTATNVVPAEAVLSVEVRAFDPELLETAQQTVESLAAAPTVPGAAITSTRGHAFPPMPPTEATLALARQASELAETLGFTAGHVATGGGADASLIAAEGVPTLDGLGPVGGNPHAPDEYLDLTSLAPRTALLAALIARSASS